MTLRRFARNLSLHRKLAVVFFLLSTLPLTLMGALLLARRVSTLRADALRSVRSDVRDLREKTGLFLTRIENELRLLSRTSELRLLRTSLRGEPARRMELRAIAEAEFQSLLDGDAFYSGVALLDHRGREVFRLSADGAFLRPVSEDQRMKTPLHYYVNLAGEMGPGDIRFSPSELRAANGELRPSVDCVLPLFDEARTLDAILVARIDASRLFDLLTPARTGSQATIAIANGEGRYLYHSGKRADWTRLLATREEETVQHEYPQSLAAVMLGGGEGTAHDDPSRIVEYAPIFSSGLSRASRYVLFADIPTAVIFAPLASLKRLFVLALAGVGVLSALFGVVVARRFVTPLAELIRGTHRIRQGDLNHRIGLTTQGELQELVDAVNQLAAEWQEKERLQKALDRAERRYASFVRNVSSAIWRIDFSEPIDIHQNREEILAQAKERAVFAEGNAAAKELYGRGGNPVGRPAAEVFPDPSSFERIVTSVLERGSRAEEAETIEGDRHLIGSNVAEVLDGKLVRIWGSQTDITRLKLAQEELRKLSRIVEQTTDIIFTTDKSGAIEYVNSAFEALTGYTASEVAGKTPRILKSGNHGTEYYAELWRAILAGETYRTVIANRKKSGELFIEEKVISPLRDASGRITRFVSTGRDITARRRQEEERERLVVELRESLAAVKILSGLLPICSSCKKIRDDKGYWSEVETYVGKHTDASFSHGICPDCAQKLYPDFFPE